MTSLLVVTGDPRPSVKWWRKGEVYDESFEETAGGIVRNDLEIRRLSAADLLSVLTCQASNSDSLTPLEASILIDITRKLIRCLLALARSAFPLVLFASPASTNTSTARDPVCF